MRPRSYLLQVRAALRGASNSWRDTNVKFPISQQRRCLRIGPPYLLDDYTPRYHLLPSAHASRKRSEAYAHLSNCNLCPRLCGVNRFTKTGVCMIGANVKIATIAPHFGEEPCIQGHNGSGSVFFSGCNLRCVFCQNHDIAHTRSGFDVEPEKLAEWYVKLQDVGKVHNINLVTPEHVVPQVVLSILKARELGLRLPIVYNTSSFDSLESIKLLDGLVDIYLADFKVWKPETSKRLLKADDYAAEARKSIKLMHDQVGDLCFTSDGLAKRGVLLRHLVMPGCEDEGMRIMEWLAKEVSPDLVVHCMEQYAPRGHVGKPRRTTTRRKSTNLSGNNDQVSSNVQPDDFRGGTPLADPVKQIRYGDLNRAVKGEEVDSVRSAAERAGLWRFIDAAEHGMFHT